MSKLLFLFQFIWCCFLLWGKCQCEESRLNCFVNVADKRRRKKGEKRFKNLSLLVHCCREKKSELKWGNLSKWFLQIHVMIKQISDVRRAILKIDLQSLVVHFRQIFLYSWGADARIIRDRQKRINSLKTLVMDCGRLSWKMKQENIAKVLLDWKFVYPKINQNKLQMIQIFSSM